MRAAVVRRRKGTSPGPYDVSMKRMMVGVLVAAVLSFSSVAVAQTKAPKAAKAANPVPAAKVNKSDSCAEQRKHNPKADCVLEIEGDRVTGQVQQPTGDDITGGPTTVHPNLIRIRHSMVDKMVKSSDRM